MLWRAENPKNSRKMNENVVKHIESLMLMDSQSHAYCPLQFMTRLADIIRCVFVRRNYVTVNILYVVFFMISLNRSLPACAAGKSDAILNCSDNIIGKSIECHDRDTLDHVQTLAMIYQKLSNSRENDLAFLGKQAKMLLYRSLNNCRNQFAGESSIELVNTCIGRQLDAHQKLTQGPVTTSSLLDILRHGEFLTLDLIVRFPSEFLGLHADWFASMQLQPVDERRLAGIISNDLTNLRFPVIMAHPDADERIFFTEAGCKHGCFSWWSGLFERRAGRIMFFADSRRETYRRRFGPDAAERGMQ